MEKLISIILVISFAMIIIPCFGLTNSELHSQFNTLISKVPDNRLADLGFSSRKDISKIEFAQSIEVANLNINLIKIGLDHPTLPGVLNNSTFELIPIHLNGKYLCAIGTDIVNGKTKAVTLGFHDLSSQLELIQEQYPSSRIKLIRVTTLQQYYFTILDAKDSNCTKITFSSISSDKYRQLDSFDDFLKNITLELQTADEVTK